ncbi:MAG: N-acetylglucosamine-6-phosphate deacetylase [Cyanobacteria bacterium P01_D01_bin.36]
MLESTVIDNARLPHRPGLYQIAIKAGHVHQIEPADAVQPGTRQAIDFAGDWLSLGAVDLQINGALGLAFPDLRLRQLDQLQTICERLWQQGVSGFCPTIVTTSLDNFHGCLAAIQTFQQRQEQGTRQFEKGAARVLGVHLEGPFLNEAKRGAHPAEYLQPLTIAAMKRLLGDFASAVCIVTLAPEQGVDDGVIGWLVSQGITVSLGHSLASEAQARGAIAQGATMVTHAFNAMPGLHHREPGLLGAALSDPRVSCGFIADGQHICKTMLDVLLRIGRGGEQSGVQSVEGLFLVSDALSPLGLPDGRYPWDSRTIEVVNGTARLPDGTLSGTTLPLVKGALNLVEWGLCSVDDAIALITKAPRQAIGIPTLEPGSPADLLRWHQNEQGQLTWQRLQ